MNADGSNPTALTDPPTNTDDISPLWTRDSSKIVFCSSRTGAAIYDIFIMNSDGTNLINLTNDSSNNYYCYSVEWCM